MMKLYTNEIETIIETKIKPNMRKIYDMRVHGFTDKQIAKYLGITNVMFLRLVKEYDDLEEVYNQATQLLSTELREVVFARALGTDGKSDKEGNALGPDANLALRLLEKLDPAFGKKEVDTNVVLTVEHVIRDINEKRRLAEKEDEDDEVPVV